jgi:L-malate glycosyltransferase
MYRLYIIKRQIEDIVLFPFILLGKMITSLQKPQKEYDIYFFFSFYHIGGAEKVHAQVAQALGNPNCIIYFTRRSHNDLFYEQFIASGCAIKDISKYTDNKFLYFLNLIYRGILAHRINSQEKKPVVFNGQCNIGYKISPWIRKDIPQVELIHSFNTFSWIRIPFLPFIHQTVMISKVRIDNHLQQYCRLKIPAQYDSRIRYIGNGIKLSSARPKTHGLLRVLYMGRATAEKRVHLVARMAQAVGQTHKDIEFLFVGDAEQAIPKELHGWCKFLPFENDENRIRDIYDKADILMIVSDTEGFPMVVMEAMSQGCAIIATPVGDLPVHVKNEVNGFLFTTVNDEDQVVAEGVDYIQRLKTDSTLRQKITQNNIAYAAAHFSIEQFNRNYRELIDSLKKQSD